MALHVSCTGCGKDYTLKDEFAGKRFRCKACETVNQAPELEEELEETFAEAGDEDEDEADEEEFSQPATKRPARNGAGKRKAAAGGMKNMRAVVIALVGLIAIGGTVGGMALVRSDFWNDPIRKNPWETFRPRNDAFTVDMPDLPERRQIFLKGPGDWASGCDYLGQEFVVLVEMLDRRGQAMSDDELFDQKPRDKRVPTYSKVTLAGRTAYQKLEDWDDKGKMESIVVRMPDRVCSFRYYYYTKRYNQRMRDKFFGSVKFL